MTQKFVTLPREVVEQAIDALYCTDSEEGSPAYNFELKAVKELRAALEQPQRKLTTQDIADGALLGNIESPFNACMHQEHCKRWKEQAEHQPPTTEESSAVHAEKQAEPVRVATVTGVDEYGPMLNWHKAWVDMVGRHLYDGPQPAQQHRVDHQHKTSNSKDLRVELQGSNTSQAPAAAVLQSGGIPPGWKLVPVEPTVEMMDAGGAATRRCYQHLNKDEVMCSYVYRHMLAAAPQPPTTEQSSAVQQPKGEQGPEPSLAGAIRAEPTELIRKWRVLELIKDHAHPQPKREPLTEDVIERLWYQSRGVSIPFARAVEASHNIK